MKKCFWLYTKVYTMRVYLGLLLLGQVLGYFLMGFLYGILYLILMYTKLWVVSSVVGVFVVLLIKIKRFDWDFIGWVRWSCKVVSKEYLFHHLSLVIIVSMLIHMVCSVLLYLPESIMVRGNAFGVILASVLVIYGNTQTVCRNCKRCSKCDFYYSCRYSQVRPRQ